MDINGIIQYSKFLKQTFIVAYLSSGLHSYSVKLFYAKKYFSYTVLAKQ